MAGRKPSFPYMACSVWTLSLVFTLVPIVGQSADDLIPAHTAAEQTRAEKRQTKPTIPMSHLDAANNCPTYLLEQISKHYLDSFQFTNATEFCGFLSAALTFRDVQPEVVHLSEGEKPTAKTPNKIPSGLVDRLERSLNSDPLTRASQIQPWVTSPYCLPEAYGTDPDIKKFELSRMLLVTEYSQKMNEIRLSEQNQLLQIAQIDQLLGRQPLRSNGSRVQTRQLESCEEPYVPQTSVNCKVLQSCRRRSARSTHLCSVKGTHHQKISLV